MIGSTPPRRPNARRLGGIRLVAALRLRTVASLRPCAARFSPPGTSRRRGTNHPDRRSRRDLATPITQGEMSEFAPRPAPRRSKRAHRTDDADAVVLRSKVLPDGERFRVRTADISEGGVAFVTELHLAVGDRIMLSVWIGARPITMEALVMRIEPMSFGRSRIACEVDSIADHDREAVSQIAHSYDEGDASARNPQATAARVQGRSEQHALQSRLAVRRYIR